MRKKFFVFGLLAICLFAAMNGSTEVLPCVDDGKLLAVEELGGNWSREEGYVAKSGQAYLMSEKSIGPGDFRVRAKLSIHDLEESAASFVVGDKRSNFGFSGGTGNPFVEGAFFRSATKSLGDLPVEEGKIFTFLMVREGNEITFRIDGEIVYEMDSTQEIIGQVGFRPWRSTMRIYDFSIRGTLIEPLEIKSKGYSLPIIDLAEQKHRQAIVDQEEGQYLGHPTTVLLEDNKTMIAVYPKGHGRGAIVMKRSTDGGKTWSDRLEVPDNWSTSKETPTIHQVVDSNGIKRLILFSGLYPIRMAVSEDNGHTWTPLKPIGNFGGIVAMSSLIKRKDGQYLAFFHDDGRFLHNEGKRGTFTVYMTRSDDGGLTWSAPEDVVSHPVAHLCEPGVIRSPDGDQLLMLLRENSRRFNSFYCVSNDEGDTWSEPKQLPGALTGDRHVPYYSHDGRLVVTFRDMAHETPTHGDFVAWVGTYEDIIQGREGQYRVRLLDNKKGADTGYAGLELLPNGIFVTTTYCHLYEGKPPLIASVRFQMSELDAVSEKMEFEQQDIFISGENGYHTYRIPSLIATTKGSLLAICEGRMFGGGDHGNIDLMIRRSTDGGETWSDQQVIYEEGGKKEITIGNPCPVVDQETGRIWLSFCRDNDDVFITYSDDDGQTWAEPTMITDSVKKDDWTWYATGPGVGIQKQREPHKGRLIIPCDHRERINGQWVKMSHVFYSDDGGETWKLGASVAKHTDECQVVELSNGNVMINMRNYWQRDGGIKSRGGMRAVAISKDGGESWGELSFDEQLIEPVCQASITRYSWADEEKSRILFSNPASTSNRHQMTVRISYDEGETWPIARQIYENSAAYSCLEVLPNGQIYCLYERDGYGKISLAAFNLEWLAPGTEVETWEKY